MVRATYQLISFRFSFLGRRAGSAFSIIFLRPVPFLLLTAFLIRCLLVSQSVILLLQQTAG